MSLPRSPAQKTPAVSWAKGEAWEWKILSQSGEKYISQDSSHLTRRSEKYLSQGHPTKKPLDVSTGTRNAEILVSTAGLGVTREGRGQGV